MLCREIIQVIEASYPREAALDFDNVGLLAGRAEKEVNRIYLALDATDHVIDSAEKAGADMLHGLRLNTVMNGKQVMIEPDLNGGAILFYEGAGDNPEDLELATFLRAVSGEGKLYVTADQAAVVTRILEGIYESDRTGKPFYFD